MEKIKTNIEGCYELQPKSFKDHRGSLTKIYHQDTFVSLGLETEFTEEYFSVSNKNVLRGLHFQIPPHDHIKCVTCLSGKIFDVVVDLRKDSITYKKTFALELSAEKGNMLYIPKGLAHGFLALTDNAIFLNRSSFVFMPESDKGIHWNSCNIDWPIEKPIVSEKDDKMISLNDFNSPF